jgi:hypothetical protein
MIHIALLSSKTKQLSREGRPRFDSRKNKMQPESENLNQRSASGGQLLSTNSQYG